MVLKKGKKQKVLTEKKTGFLTASQRANPYKDAFLQILLGASNFNPVI